MADPQTLVPGSIYTQDDTTYIALSEYVLQGLYGPRKTSHVDRGFCWALSVPTTPEWSDTMRAAFENIVTDLKGTQAAHERQSKFLDELKQSLFEQASEYSWYDEFADEFGLPTNTKVFKVVVEMNVKARDSSEAQDIVENELGISRFDEFVVTGPSIDVVED